MTWIKDSISTPESNTEHYRLDSNYKNHVDDQVSYWTEYLDGLDANTLRVYDKKSKRRETLLHHMIRRRVESHALSIVIKNLRIDINVVDSNGVSPVYLAFQMKNESTHRSNRVDLSTATFSMSDYNETDSEYIESTETIILFNEFEPIISKRFCDQLVFAHIACSFNLHYILSQFVEINPKLMNEIYYDPSLESYYHIMNRLEGDAVTTVDILTRNEHINVNATRSALLGGDNALQSYIGKRGHRKYITDVTFVKMATLLIDRGIDVNNKNFERRDSYHYLLHIAHKFKYLNDIPYDVHELFLSNITGMYQPDTYYDFTSFYYLTSNDEIQRTFQSIWKKNDNLNFYIDLYTKHDYRDTIIENMKRSTKGVSHIKDIISRYIPLIEISHFENLNLTSNEMETMKSIISGEIKYRDYTELLLSIVHRLNVNKYLYKNRYKVSPIEKMESYELIYVIYRDQVLKHQLNRYLEDKNAIDSVIPVDVDHCGSCDCVIKDRIAAHGTDLDTLIGLIYLLKKHSNACMSITEEFIDNFVDATLSGIGRKESQLISKMHPFMFWRVGVDYTLLDLPYKAKDTIKRCISNETVRFVIIPMVLTDPDSNAHAGILIYDKINRILERFEPHGADSLRSFEPKLLDSAIEKTMKPIIGPGMRYLSPMNITPDLGPQAIAEMKEISFQGDPEGFCMSWTLWYADLRMSNPDKPGPELIHDAIRKINLNNMNYLQFIRNYSQSIAAHRDTILDKVSSDYNSYLTGNMSYKQYHNLIQVHIMKELRDLGLLDR